jgi:Ca2+-transporting ATPase
MGQRGTDVAREAASLVLLHDDFASIVEAIRMGRRTYANMRQAMVYTLAVHVPIAGLAMLPVLFGLPLLLTPLHIAFLELVIDPACSLVLEAEAGPADLMSSPPRSTRETLLSRRQVLHSLVYGSLTTLAVFLLYQQMLGLFDPGIARAVAFVMLVTANAALILPARQADRSGKRILSQVTPTTVWVVAVTATALWLVTCWAPLAAAFRFESLSTMLWMIGVAGGLAMLPVFELTKYLIQPAPSR